MAGISNIGKVPELRKRILFTLSLLAVYRVGIFITVPGVNRVEMQNFISSSGSGLLGMFNMFGGGALERLSIFALGIMPYISASIIIQLMTVVVPKLDQLNKEGESGRRKINQYTRYGTIGLSLVQAFFMASMLEGMGRGGGGDFSASEVVADPGWSFRLLTMLTLTTGTAFLMWLGEQITERGIGNGISLIIFAGIVAGLPDAVIKVATLSSMGEFDLLSLIFMLLSVAGTIATVCYFERAHRRIPVQYTKRMVGRKMYGGTQSHLPLKINVSGVIPPIFASSILMFPQQMVGWIDAPWMQQFSAAMQQSDWRYNVVYVAMIVFFTFFYTAVTFNPVDVAENLKKGGGFVPGIRPGKKTAEYIDRVLSRITCGGAAYLSAVCVTPILLQKAFGVPAEFAGIFGGTALLIIVGVALDTVQQVESHLITRNYDGFTGPKGPRIRGRSTSRKG
ncbi:MAG: preprotein translocase subunit SecY [Myxococcales bacterium]|nr:preprotein translocase subunit SecY [Myxococcales bacterium]